MPAGSNGMSFGSAFAAFYAAAAPVKHLDRRRHRLSGSGSAKMSVSFSSCSKNSNQANMPIKIAFSPRLMQRAVSIIVIPHHGEIARAPMIAGPMEM
jgi:hypothetical protein